MEKQDFLLKLGGKIPDATVLVPFKIIKKISKFSSEYCR